MNDERNDATDQGQQTWEPQPSASAGTDLTEADRERIHAEEARLAAEQQYRDEVRQGYQQEQHWGAPQSPAMAPGPAAGRSDFWRRVLGMLSFEPGIVQEIASAPDTFKQGMIVVASAVAIANLIGFIVIPIVFVFVLCGVGVNALVLRLTSRLFSKQASLGYAQWYRALLFTTAPVAIWLIPFIGHAVGVAYQLVLTVVVTRDLAGLTTGRAVLAVFLPTLVVMGIGLVLVFFAAAALMTMLGGLFGGLSGGFPW